MILSTITRTSLLRRLRIMLNTRPRALYLRLVVTPLRFNRPFLRFLFGAPSDTVRTFKSNRMINHKRCMRLHILDRSFTNGKIRHRRPFCFITRGLSTGQVLLMRQRSLGHISPRARHSPNRQRIVAHMLSLRRPTRRQIPVSLITGTRPRRPISMLLQHTRTMSHTRNYSRRSVPANRRTINHTIPRPLSLLISQKILLSRDIHLKSMNLKLMMIMVTSRMLGDII